MKFWETVTGSDLTREWKAFEDRAQALPADYQPVWAEIKVQLLPHADFTGRNLTPVFDGILGILEETAADGQGAREAVGDDVAGFCAAVVGKDGARTYRDKWREQLNKNVARKLGRLGE